MNPKVVVTGWGALTACGSTVAATWDSVRAGRTGIEKIRQWDTTGWAYSTGGEVKDYDPRKLVADRKLLKLLSRQDVLGLGAAAQALDHSGLVKYRDGLADPTAFNDRTGIFAGAPGTKYCQQYELLAALPKAGGDTSKFGAAIFDSVHPMWLLRILPNNVLAYVGIQYGFKGPNENITNHGVSGTQAILEAYRSLRCGDADRAIVVGYEAGVEPEGIAYYGGMGLLSPETIRPFDASRDGTVLAEGAAAVILETLESAQARGATILGEILGGATTSEAQGIVPIRHDGEGVARAIRLALRDAGFGPDEIGMVVAHGNGTVPSDASEALAIGAAFDRVPVTAFKWATGHTLAAAGVIETILALLSLDEGRVPGIAPLKRQAHDCAAVSVSSAEQKPRKPRALLVSRAYGSLNSCLVIGRE